MKVSIIGIVFLVGMLLIMLPNFEDIPPEKMTSISMARCISDIRKSIKADVEKGSAIKTDYKNNCPELISRLNVSQNGRIEMFNKVHRINLSFEPVLNNGIVKWSCSGSPQEFVPKACRQKALSSNK